MNFTPLGYAKNNMQIVYFFFLKDRQQVTAYTNAHLSASALRELHPDITFWEETYPHQKFKVDANKAAADLITQCTAKGLFDPDVIRNRGAWMDDGRVVVHTGKKLIVNGQPVDMDLFDTEFIYEKRKSINYKLGTPIDTEQGERLVDALRLYNWEKPEFAEMLAGWCFVAPICGALNWRPHIWVSGSSGVGKTKLMKDTVWQLLEDIAITPEGESTEAGIRQTLDGEALPVLFDEVEADTREAQQRMDGILNLMRSASSGKSGQILKGGATHSSKSFRIRSCFAFSSIVYQATKKADRSRISVLGLIRNPNHDDQRAKWDDYNRIIHETITPEFVQGFRTRSVQLLPKTIEAAEVFSSVIGKVLSDRRLGDQIGTMIAGCWMLQNDEPPTTDEAERFVSSRNYYDTDNDDMLDELQLIRYIMQQTIFVEVETGRTEQSIGELVHYAANNDGYSISPIVANNHLGRCGICTDEKFTYISNSSSYLTRVLDGTQWSKNHHKILKRIDGAIATSPKRFTSGNVSRAIAIPNEIVMK